MLFGDKIKELREAHGLLQRQIANQLDIDTPLYSKLERGERLPKEELISRLAQIFNVTEKDLRILWLADKVLKTVQSEPEINQDAIRLVNIELTNV